MGPLESPGHEQGTGPEQRRFPSDCPELEGAAVLEDRAVFACREGWLVIEEAEGALEARPLPYPSSGRARTLAPASQGPLLYADREGSAGLWRLDLEREQAQAVSLPAAPAAFAFEPVPEGRLVVLTVTGELLSLDPATGESTGRVQVLEGESEKEGPSPALALARGKAFVSEPEAQRVTVIDLQTLEILRRLRVEGAPGQMVVIGRRWF